MPKHIGVETNLERINKTSTASLSICGSFCKQTLHLGYENLYINAAFFSEIYKEHTNPFCVQNVEFFNFKLGGT
jgi:hypothetical protein